MRLLLDTNIFLEVLLDQDSAKEAKDLLSAVEEHELFLSDYSLHSIGLLLFRRGQHDVFQRFLEDMIFDGGVTVLVLPVREIGAVAQVARRFKLDFDDAYQYTVADRFGLTIVSFDGDFDQTERGRRTPKDLLGDKR
ncbi:MAG: type II toxin-antitoxin system VapC family toxin [Methanothrix sp.]|uniref:type II toxin-antitoxin system VapC family toxin n=1 Tax=Methanothrix sp. TaxID=90426 RepID=UPI0019CBD185|nr:PIN domain-containing protein [Methanothrix sp.]MBC7078983.1 type II toxin-antitoxin system VapC family toxin [Methanothrix sp.]NPU87144.1 type II toxin-antitoxin system VapC family toxin [Methanothrix sp.]